MKTFGKQSKKQPFRNLLKRMAEKIDALEKERDELRAAKQKTQILTASLQREREAAAELTVRAQEKEKTAQKFKRYAREELKHINKFHPSLMTERYIGSTSTVSTTDAFQYRMLAPAVNWNSSSNQALVKLVFGKANSYETDIVAYGLDRPTVERIGDEISEEFLNDVAQRIARDLLQLAKEKMEKY